MRPVYTLLHNNQTSKNWRIIILTIIVNATVHIFYTLITKYCIFSNNSELNYQSYGPVNNLNKNRVPYFEENVKHQIEPIILHWTPFWKVKFAPNHMNTLINNFPSCKYKCFHTEDRTFVNNSQAILFHTYYTNKNDLPPERNDQFRVFFTREGPYQIAFPNN